MEFNEKRGQNRERARVGQPTDIFGPEASEDAELNGPMYPADLTSRFSDTLGFVDMSEILGVIWRNKLRIASTALLGGAATYALVSQISPTYTSRAQLVMDPRYSVMANNPNAVQSLTLSNSVIASEMSILRSNLLLDRVVNTLNLRAVPEYNPILAMQGAGDGTLPVASEVGGGALGYDVGGQPANPGLASPDQTSLIRRLQSNLGISQDGISYVINITATAQDPILAAAIANTTASAYLDRQAEVNRSAIEGATNWLDERVEGLRAQVSAAEGAVETYKAQNLTLEGGSADTFSQQIIALTGQVAQTRARRVTAEVRYEQVREILDREGVAAAAAVAQSPLINTLREQRAQLQRVNADLANVYDVNDPRMARARADLSSLDGEIATETRRQVEGLRSEAEVAAREVASLEESLRQMQGRALELSQSTIQLRQLEREAEAVRGVYEGLLGRLQENRAIEEVQSVDAQIITRADPSPRPSAPRKGPMTALGVVLGGMIGMGWVFLRELRTPRYRTAQQLSQDTGLTVLTTLPRLRAKGAARRLMELVQSPHSPYAEHVRRLRNDLSRQCEQKGQKSVTLTSALAGEGKTTTTLALARMAGLSGKRVIVIDADLRNPSLGFMLPGAPKADLAAVLTGAAQVKDAIVTDIALEGSPAGFDVLPTREPSAAVADKLSQPVFLGMLRELERDYDLVLIDSPPVLNVSDAGVISGVAGLTVLVVHADKTPAKAVREAMEYLRTHSGGSAGRETSRLAGAVLTMQHPRFASAYGRT